ncbi:MAG TPA: hypothetical protein VFU31_27415, partial [Candidatus Binatia bacterium]|nr:hypothetical protein [Candidatus Binatia bacterium]
DWRTPRRFARHPPRSSRREEALILPYPAERSEPRYLGGYEAQPMRPLASPVRSDIKAGISPLRGLRSY